MTTDAAPVDLTGRTLLITGVLTEASIAFGVARAAQNAGAAVLLTAPSRTRGVTERIARRLPKPATVLDLDVTSDADLAGLAAAVRAGGATRLDGVLHAIAYAPPAAIGGGFLDVSWEDAALALHISSYSLVALTRALLDLLPPGAAIVGLDFDATRAWPNYDWMGVAKAALESITRYLARDLGPRGVTVNLVAAGPLLTPAARGIAGMDALAGRWSERAPLGWDSRDSTGVATTCLALLGGHLPVTTGTVLHADGGATAMGW